MYKVVIVDDEDTIVNGLKQVLDWEKYNCKVVATADNAKSGAVTIREHRPDIVFTDIKMPGIDGLTMISGLKSEFPDMQITVLTGHRDFDFAKRALNLGVTRYLLKPSKMKEIEEAIQAMTKKLKSIIPDEEDQEKAAVTSSANSFIVDGALKYIGVHYAEKLSLTELADKIYVSQWYLSKLLNKYTGKSFYDLLNQTRIEKARELLEDPSLKVHEVSEMVGFNDVAHFSRIFKKTTGLSPKEYRNSIHRDAKE